MIGIWLLPFGSVLAEPLAELRTGLSHEFAVPCEILQAEPDPRVGLQCHSPAVPLYRDFGVHDSPRDSVSWRLLGITRADLHILILILVFGEAQLLGSGALISAHRLHQEFYGLPSDPAIVHDRLLKEAIHELGHALALSHCEDYQPVMSPPTE